LEAWVYALEGMSGALDTTFSFFTGDTQGIISGLGNMTSTLLSSLGYNKTSKAIGTLSDAYSLYEGISGLKEQVTSAKTVIEAVQGVGGVSGVNWFNMLKAGSSSGVGKLHKDVIFLGLSESLKGITQCFASESACRRYSGTRPLPLWSGRARL